MYQALYRKYRPKTFEEIVGQDVIVKTLKNSIKNNIVSHAYFQERKQKVIRNKDFILL